MNILDLPMGYNDADAKTVRDYFKALLLTLWKEEEGFSGKRPFGNSGWQYDVYRALANAGAISEDKYDDGEVKSYDTKAADKIILSAIEDVMNSTTPGAQAPRSPTLDAMTRLNRMDE
jgi:hypothetical protein